MRRTMSFVRTVAQRSAVMGLAAMTGLGLVALPAQAAGVQITSQECDSAGGKYSCLVHVSGGTAPYTYAWTSILNAGAMANGGFVRGVCVPRARYRIAVTVTDATGLTAHSEMGGYCDPFFE
jgi:hypothetical protein